MRCNHIMSRQAFIYRSGSIVDHAHKRVVSWFHCRSKPHRGSPGVLDLARHISEAVESLGEICSGV